MNVSLLGKHVWSMLHERNKLWVELLSKKSTILHDNIKPGTSYLWIFILKAAAILELGFRFRVGEGKGSMQFDRWSTHGALCHKVDYDEVKAIH